MNAYLLQKLETGVCGIWLCDQFPFIVFSTIHFSWVSIKIFLSSLAGKVVCCKCYRYIKRKLYNKELFQKVIMTLEQKFREVVFFEL